MRIMSALRRVLSVLVLIFLFSGILPAQSKRPNIIFMMSDDHAYQAISAYGHGLNRTPHIDGLAASGVLFTRAFVSNSICGPSRAVFLTGKHSHKNGFKDNRSTFNGDQQTFVKLLKQAGYQTAITGKWHLVSNPQGFDYWNILPGQGDYYNPRFIENGVQKNYTGYVTNLTTDLALQWLDRRDTSRPFFLVCNQKAPHRNWMPEQKYLNLFDSTEFPVPANYFDDYAGRGRAAREQEMEVANDMHPYYDLKLGLDLPAADRVGLGAAWQNIFNRMSTEEKAGWTKAYGPVIDAYRARPPVGRDLAILKYQRYMRDYMRCVQSVDDNVGRMMEYLRKQGLDQNTIVIYTSDQGFYLGEHGWFDKRFMYEESFRTPLIIRWPGVTDAGRKSASLVQNIDMAETLLDMAGLSIPSDMQGRSMVPVLNGKQRGNLHDGLYYHFYENQEHRVAKHFGIRTDRYKLIYFYELGEWELYDLTKDPSEMSNVYDRSSYAGVRKRLRASLKGLVDQYDDPEARAALLAAR